jgi:hypothetical protein
LRVPSVAIGVEKKSKNNKSSEITMLRRFFNTGSSSSSNSSSSRGLLLLLLARAIGLVASSRMLTAADLPVDQQHRQWVSLQPGVEFLPASSGGGGGEYDNIVLHSKQQRNNNDWRRMIEQSQREFFQKQPQQQGSRHQPPWRRNVEEVVEDEAYVDESTINTMYNSQPFVEGVSDYDEYQQAWRLLGFMIDCDAVGDDDVDSHDNKNNNNGGQRSADGCGRFLIWAAVRFFR